MAEKVSGAVSGFMSPGIGIVTSWQGITEIVIRGVIIIMALIMALAGGSCQSAAAELPPGALGIQPLTDSAAGWLMFVGVLIIIYEALMITQRFINIKVINQHIFIVIIVDVVESFVMAFFILTAAIALAVYNPQWQDVRSGQGNGSLFNGILDRIIGATGAASFFGFLTVILHIGKGVFMIVGGLVLGWGPTKAKYNASSASGGE